MLLLGRLEAAERYADLPDELVVAQLVLITHGDPGRELQGQGPLGSLSPTPVWEKEPLMEP